MKVKTSKGFTLAELLIVMAIIVVLAAVAIPTFGKQLETSRETGDMEIIRNAYTEALSIATLDGADGTLNGVIGNGSAAAAAGTWGAVAVAATTDIVEATSSVTNKATYTVTLASMGGARFAQAATSATTPAAAWKYVNPTLMGCTVPIVNTSHIKVKFQFEINANGEIQLVADSPAGTPTAITVSTT